MTGVQTCALPIWYYNKAINKFEDAIKSFQHSNLSQFTIIGFLNLGYIQLQSGEIDEAIINFNRVIDNGTHEYSPIHFADAFYYLGMANLSKNNFNAALEAFTKNIEICNQTNNYIKESLTLFKLIIGCIRFESTELATSYYDRLRDRKSTRLNSSHTDISRMPSSA